MTSKELAMLIEKLKSHRDEGELDHTTPLTKDEAEFLLELIVKNWRSNAPTDKRD